MRACLLSLLIFAGCDDGRVTGDDAGIVDAAIRSDAGTPGEDAGTTPGVDAALPPPSPLVDPDCVDGMYTEALPNPGASISDLVAGYSGSSLETFVLAALERRYPIGRAITAGGEASDGCIASFVSDTSSASAVIESMSTIVHECGHMYDNSLGDFTSNAYFVSPSLTLTCADGNSTQLSGLTFERSRIVSDAFQSDRAPCGGTPTFDCDFYADLYLDGDPDDASFQSGDQGYSMLLEEAFQYVNSLAASLAFTNELSSRTVSERDGILTMLWYVMRYLRMARLEFPSAYAHILSGDGGCWRDATLTMWGRAWLYLEATDGMAHLGLSDDVLMGFVTNAELLGEIQRLRDAAGCTL
jgi:hypothetical protein